MAKLELEDAMLILGGWLDSSTKLFVESSLRSVSVRFNPCSVTKLEAAGFLLESSKGDGQLSISIGDADTSLAYCEPREFSTNEEFAELLASLPEVDKCRSAIGISFDVRVKAPQFEDLLVPLGKVVLVAIGD